MRIFTEISLLRNYLFSQKQANKTLGLVATMGALHQGHLSLIFYSKKDNDLSIASIFVNPIQFDKSSDLEKYPKKTKEDLDKLEQAGCDIVFLPDAKQMYGKTPKVKMIFEGLDNTMEGEHREGHFSGVGVVVAKLFNIIQPTRAYFGQKDLQQFAVIRQMTEDLSFETEVISCPIVREKDGLAMSSRNLRLTEKEREVAPKFQKSLLLAQKTLKSGKTTNQTSEIVREFMEEISEFELEYFSVVDSQSLEAIEIPQVGQSIALCAAAFLGNVRLIDNIVFNFE